MSYDITFCDRECNNKNCKRNLAYVDKKLITPLISIAEFNKCEKWEEIK